MFDRVPAIRFLLNSIFVKALIVVLGLFVNGMAGFALPLVFCSFVSSIAATGVKG